MEAPDGIRCEGLAKRVITSPYVFIRKGTTPIRTPLERDEFLKVSPFADEDDIEKRRR